jgi:hypothetical protein
MRFAPDMQLGAAVAHVLQQMHATCGSTGLLLASTAAAAAAAAAAGAAAVFRLSLAPQIPSIPLICDCTCCSTP